MIQSNRRGLTTGTTVAILATVVAVLSVGLSAVVLLKRPAEAGPAAAPEQEVVTGVAAAVDQTTGGDGPTPSPEVNEALAEALASKVPVEVDPPVLAFGRIAPGEVVSGSVSIRNPTDEPLRILSTKASCKCTTLDLANTVIPPGESVTLEAGLDPGHALGNKKSGVKIIFDGYLQPVQLPVTAEVGFDVSVQPAYINAFSSGGGNASLSGELTVQSADGVPFEILAMGGSPPAFIDFDPATDELESSYRLAYDLTRFDPTTCVDAEGNPMPGWIPIEVDHPTCGIVDVAVRHFCTRNSIPPQGQDWMLSEQRIVAGRLAEGEHYDFTVKMLWIRGATPNAVLTRATSDSDAFSAELVDVSQDGDQISATVRITPTPGFRGLIEGRVLIGTDEHDARVLILGRAVE